MTFSELSRYFQKLEATTSRNAMTQILSQLFRKAHKDEIAKMCFLLQGRVVPLYLPIEFGIADKMMIRAIRQAYSCDEMVVVKAFKETGDMGIAAQRCYEKKSFHDGKLSVSQVYDRLYEVAMSGGAGSQEKKVSILSETLRSVDSLSAKYITRIVLDKLRLGFSEMTILDAFSWMLAGDKSLRPRLEGAYNVRPDLGVLAQHIKEHGIRGARRVQVKVGAPILAALCQRLPSADEMVKKMGTVDVEPKYDGVRVQIHFKRSGFKLPGKTVVAQTFSRNLENTTGMFPEVQHIGERLKAREAILDSEAIGYDAKSGKFISFQETMTRKRKHNIELFSESVPLKFFVFDILYKDGKNLLGVPLSQRRRILDETIINGRILVESPHIVTTDAGEVRAYHDAQLNKGLEGAVVKKWESPYEPGRRGYNWVKFKEEEGRTGKLTDTIDAVVMGYYVGRGKRVGFGIGAFLVGVKKNDAFVTVTKIGTGVSDELWRELRKRLHALAAKEKPKEYDVVNKIFLPDVWVSPEVVVEVAGDDLTKSPTHGAGIAIRFPRLVRIRDDKSPKDTTTAQEVMDMYKSQGK